MAVEPKWLPSAAVVFVAYIMGSIIRAFPVDRIDRQIGALVRWPCKLNSKGDNARTPESMLYRLYSQDFPYLPLLKQHYDTLPELRYLKPSTAVDATLPEGRRNDFYLHVAFDFWKSWLYVAEPGAAPRIQEFEARTRMFCGLFWAGVVAAVISVASARWSHMWWVPMCMSALLAALCGWRLRNIRCEEARQVFFAFLVSDLLRTVQQTSAQQDATERTLEGHTIAMPSSSGLQLSGSARF